MLVENDKLISEETLISKNNELILQQYRKNSEFKTLSTFFRPQRHKSLSKSDHYYENYVSK